MDTSLQLGPRSLKTPQPTDAAASLSAVLGQLHRSLRRRQREFFGQSSLSSSGIELLRTIRDQPGIRSGDLARSLGLAPNTASTLIGSLRDRGYLMRQVDPGDRRASKLSLTPSGHEILLEWRDYRRTVLAQALQRLEDVSPSTVSEALATLELLANIIESEDFAMTL